MEYRFKTEEFEGPLGRLLELIERSELEITRISLAKVTEDFLAYFRIYKEGREKILPAPENREHLQTLVEFIVIASRLILIKSKSLIPDIELSEKDEEDIAELERRLVIYKELKPVIKHIVSLWKSGGRAMSRPYFLSAGTFPAVQGGSSVFFPGGNLTKENLREALDAIFKKLQAFHYEEEKLERNAMTIEEEMTAIIAHLEQIQHATYGDLTHDKSKSAALVVFLALLHLARDQAVSLYQESHFSDILVKKQESTTP